MRGYVRERGKGNWYAVIDARSKNGKAKAEMA
jgi:hypothetical protein